jgi:uncharacterized protein YehS (DUF1456 family)
MTNNDILRRFRYALDISNAAMIDIFRQSGYEIDQQTLIDLLKKEDEEGYRECTPALMTLFLDGLIIQKRGRRESAAFPVVQNSDELTNNAILKKLRIALDLKEDDMIAIMRLASVTISKSELSALFRNPGHKNYKKCGDQFLRNFLQGLTIRFRSAVPVEE